MLDLNHPQTKIIFQASTFLDVLITICRDYNIQTFDKDANRERLLSAIKSLQQIAKSEYIDKASLIEKHLLIIEDLYFNGENNDNSQESIFKSISILDHELGTWAI